MWGTLSATILAHPVELRDPLVGGRIDAAVADLRYGVDRPQPVARHGVRVRRRRPGARTRATPSTDIQSGTGVVGNALMFDRPQKSVVTGPFRSSPLPSTFATSRAGVRAPRRFVDFVLDPGAAKLPGLLAAALR